MPIYTATKIVPVSSPPIEDGGVVVVGGAIEAVGELAGLREAYPGEQVKDFGEAVIAPGFINCHSHLELTAYRGRLDSHDHDFGAWLREITILRRDESSETIKLSALLGAAEAASMGITTVGDIGRRGSAGFSALKQVGLRGIVFQETEFYPSNKTAESDFDKFRAKYESLADGSTGLVTAGMSPHAPYTVSARLFELIAEYAERQEVPIAIHAAESNAEERLMVERKGVFGRTFLDESVDWDCPGLTTIEFLDSCGILSVRPLLVHCVRVSDKEIGLISRAGARVAHCPKSNAKFGHGVARVSEFVKATVPTGLGSDSVASNNGCDMLEEARFAGLVARTITNGRFFFTPEELFRMATLGGAEALGVDRKTGSLEAGKQADFAVISLDGPSQQPPADIFSTLVFSTSATAVLATYVGGKPIYENGVPTNVEYRELRSSLTKSLNEQK